MGILGGFSGASLATCRAKPALARETEGMRCPTVTATVAYKAVLFAATAQSLFDRIARCRCNIAWQLALQARFDSVPVVAEDAMKNTWLVHPIPVTTL